MKFRARFIANIIQFAAHQGVSRKVLLAITGKTLPELNDEELTFEAPVYNKIIEKIVSDTGNEYFGLQLGASLSLSASGLILQITQSSRTVEEALHYMVEFNNLGCQAMPFRLQQLDGEWQLSVHPSPAWEAQSPVAVRHTMDGMMVFTLRQFEALTRQRYEPRRIHFSYSRPANTKAYERLISCPIHFKQAATCLWLDERQVAEPIVTSDYQLLRILVDYAEQKLEKLHNTQGFKAKVRQAVVQLATPAFPTIEQVANNLNLSVRSLQRRLKAEQYTYQQLTDELKHQFSLEYLKKQDLSVKEIAYLLDYADASSFIRSFKRWEGSTPVEFRRSSETGMRN